MPLIAGWLPEIVNPYLLVIVPISVPLLCMRPLIEIVLFKVPGETVIVVGAEPVQVSMPLYVPMRLSLCNVSQKLPS